MTVKLLILLFVFGFSAASDTKRRTLHANIPAHLKPCYDDPMVIQDNLLPMTTTTFIALIRKIENAYKGTTDARVLVEAILNRYRLDGIMRNPAVVATQEVIPYSPRGQEFELYRLVMEYFLPPSSKDLTDTGLTMVETCTLHRMLSLSVDPWPRSDQDSVCGSLSRKSRSVNETEAPTTERPTTVAEVVPPLLKNVQPTPKPEQTETPVKATDNESRNETIVKGPSSDITTSNCPIEGGVIHHTHGAIAPGLVLAGLAAGLEQQNVLTKDVQKARPASDVKDKPLKQSPSMRKTLKPLVKSLSENPSIDNRHAATLAGLLAIVATLQGPYLDDNAKFKLGGDGGWNDTLVPKYYFLRERKSKYELLTDARIRSAVDGLIMANNVQKWNSNAGSNLMLSQILTLYYTNTGVFDKSMRSCKRFSHYQTVAPSTEIAEQTYAIAKLLKEEMKDVVEMTDEYVYMHSQDLSEQLSTYIINMRETSCPEERTQLNPFSYPMADLHLVVDCNWDAAQITQIVAVLGAWMQWTFPGTNITLVNGADGVQMFDTFNNFLDYNGAMSQLCNNTVTKGFRLRTVLDNLQPVLDSGLQWDVNSNTAGVTVPRIVLIMASKDAKVPDWDLNGIQSRLQSYRTTNPDVKFLYFAYGTKERFTPFVDDADKDVVVVNPANSDPRPALESINQRIGHVSRRVFNPTCGVKWYNRGYSPAQYNAYLDYNEIQYYRVHPNYFFNQGSAKIIVDTQDSQAVLNVCQSRDNPNPGNTTTTTGSVSSNCQQLRSGDKKIVYYLWDNSCKGSPANCKPFYFSVSRSTSVSSSAICADPDCPLPTSVKYTITHQKLSCQSGASALQAAAIYVFALALALRIFL